MQSVMDGMLTNTKLGHEPNVMLGSALYGRTAVSLLSGLRLIVTEQ